MTDKIFFIAGVQHHRIQDVIADLDEGTELDLVPEPDNKFDPNAVRIMSGETMLGYVPKKFSSEVSSLIEIHGDKVACYIELLDKKAKPWEMCRVSVGERDSEIQ